MQKRRHTSAHRGEPTDWPSLEQLETHAAGWVLDAEIRQLAPRTLAARRELARLLLWYLREYGHPRLDPDTVRAFLAHLTTGYTRPGGRWGNGTSTRPMRPATHRHYHVRLHGLCTYMIQEGLIPVSPLDGVPATRAVQDQVQPFRADEIDALRAAAKNSTHPARDDALLLFLLDTGARVSEAAALRFADLDMAGRSCRVLGKGNKQRTLYFGAQTTRALWAHTRQLYRADPPPGTSPVWRSGRGARKGDALTRSGIERVITRLARAAGLTGRCHPHRFRHTFAISFLKNGGNLYSLMSILGHTSPAMTQRYVALAQADIEAQHRRYGPVDHR